MLMKDMNKAINHPSRHQKPIKKVVSAIHTHKMSNRRLSIKKWSSYSTSAAFLIGTNKTLNQGLEPKQVCSTHRFC